MADYKTDATFNDMLKEYMPYDLMVEEMKRRNFFWNKISKDENWMGGELSVPFEGAEASSLSLGSLTSSDDVDEYEFVRGKVTSYRELWGTMKWKEKDLDGHGDLKTSFLKSLPGKINQFIMRMSERISLMLLNGAALDYVTAVSNGVSATTWATVTVNHPERFTLGEKLYISDDASGTNTQVLYIININMSTKVLTVTALKANRRVKSSVTGSADVLDLTSDYAAGDGLYLPGALNASAATKFSSLRDALLSAANGGSDTIYDQTKLNYPYLQAVQIDGSSYTAANILDDIFDAFMEVVTLGKGNPTEILCSMSIFAAIAKVLEPSRRFSKGDQNAGYGFRSVEVLGAEGSMKITGLRDMDSDIIYIIDWSAIKFHGSNFFNRKRHLNGDEYFLERETTGYKYVVDIKFFGDLVVSAPSYCGAVYDIPVPLV